MTEGLRCSERRKELWWVEERARRCTLIHRVERYEYLYVGGVAPLITEVKGMYCRRGCNFIHRGERNGGRVAPLFTEVKGM